MSENLGNGPPSYEAAMSPTATAPSHFSAVNSGLQTDMADAVLVFFIADGVQIFYITPEGYVSAPSYPSSLAIYQFVDEDGGLSVSASNNPDAPPAFLQIGDWMYPLMPGHSPALHSSWGSYVFPDVTASDPGSCVGVILPDSVEAEERKTFESILDSLTKLFQQKEKEPVEGERPQRTSQVISSILVTAADWISWGLVKGAEKGGKLLNYGSTKLREHMAPAEQPSSIDPRAETGAYYARRATQGAVKVSGYLVNKLSEGTAALGRVVAPHIRRHSENLLPTSFTRRNPDGSSTLDNVAEVAASGLHGFATVYTSLEHSAKILAKSIADETVHIVEHKYGADAGRFADHVVHTATSAAAASYNFSHLGLKAVAKRVAADTTSAVIGTFPSSTAAGASADTTTNSETARDAPAAGTKTFTGRGTSGDMAVVEKLELAQELESTSAETSAAAATLPLSSDNLPTETESKDAKSSMSDTTKSP